MSEFIRGGVPRDINLNGNTFHAAEGEKPTIALSGFGGDVHLAGDGDLYGESNPQIGMFNQSLSCDEDDFAILRELQNSGQKLTGYVTMPSGRTYNLFVKISNTEALTLEDGIVALETKGNVELQ